LLAEERFAARAAEVRESFQTAGGVTRAAEVIQGFARSRSSYLAVP
jgi:UDP:flavonoid glycosyltransferase YjiC (YdhE family)